MTKSVGNSAVARKAAGDSPAAATTTAAVENVENGAAAPEIDAPEVATPEFAAPSTEVVLFGLDEAGKAHASRFAAADAALAVRAAGLMGYRVLPLATPDHAAAASGLPMGRVFASGRGFVPFCSKAAYARLQALGGAYAPEAPAGAADPADGPGAPGEAGTASPATEAVPDAPEAITTPATWGDIAFGALVLASEGENMGWFEAVVTEDRGEDLFVLRWRDWPEVAPFPRRREHLALLPATSAATGGADAAPSAATAQP